MEHESDFLSHRHNPRKENYEDPSKSFLTFSALLTNRHRPQLDTLYETYSDAFPDHFSKTGLLVLNTPEISGEAKPPYGLMGVNENIFNFPEKIREMLLRHEGVHMAVGSELRTEGILAKHPAVDRLLHEKILPYWLEGKLTLETEKDYFLSKRWAPLFPGWNGPADVSKEKTVQTIDNYFSAFEKGLIRYMPSVGIAHPVPTMKLWAEAMKTENRDVNDLFEENPEQCALFVLTGYEVAAYLQTAYQQTLSLTENVPIHDMEEGFANYVSSSLAGVSLEEFNAYAPQDAGKLVMAKRIEAANPDIKEASAVDSYPALIDFYKRLNLF